MAKDSTAEKNSAVAIISAEEGLNSELGNLLIDNAEAVLDHLLQDSLLREIPAIGTAIGVIKLGADIRNRLFLQKLLRFFDQLGDISEAEKRQFVDKLQADEGFRRRVGENLILLLDHFDDVEQKPVLLARIFESYVGGTIDQATFQKLSTAVDRIKIYSLPGLLDFYDPSDHKLPEDDTLQDLVLCGLANIVAGVGLVFGDGSSKNVKRNEMGRLFVEIALREKA